MGKTSCKKGQYYCNTDKKCKPIPEGYTVREDGFLVKEGWSAKYKKSIDCNNPKGFSQKAHCAGKKKMTEESNPRIARKKGQPAKSKKHSDLYTDEDPKGTIHGLGFKDVATAKASVAKIRKSSRSHAHKIQAAIAMEQRARVMGKTAEAAVYRKFINSMKKKTKAMNEEKHGDHEYEMIRRQTDNIMVAAKKLKKKVGKGEGNAKAWVQSKITKASDYLDTAADYMTDKEQVKEGSLHKWFSGSKSKDGKGGWVNVRTGGTCASDEPGEGVPKCVSRSKYDSMSKKERESAARRKKAADPNQQEKRGAAKPTYVSTDKPKKKKKKTMKDETEFTSLPLVLEVPQSDGEFKLGLMFRESLEQDRGMLFIFESNDYWTFHMKNTFIPLDIAFIKEDGTIDSIEELDPMNPIPVGPESEIRYAVEVNRGWFAENGVVVGDRLLEEEDLTEGKDKKGKGSGTKDACYHKVKSRYSVWPSAYASGALVKCRKVGAANWGNSRKEEVEYEVNEDMEKPRMLKMAPMKMATPKLKIRKFGQPLTPEQEAGVKRYHKEKKDLKQRNVGYKPGAFYDKKGKNPDTGAQRAIGGQGGFKSRRSSGPSKDFRDDIGEGVGAALKLGGMIAPKVLPAIATGIGAVGTMLQMRKKKSKLNPNPDAGVDGYPEVGKVTTYKKDPKTGKMKKVSTRKDKAGEESQSANENDPSADPKMSDFMKDKVASNVGPVKKTKKGYSVLKKRREKAEYDRMEKDYEANRYQDILQKAKPIKNIGKKVIQQDHYDWRSGLDEQALNMAQRRAARGSSYKAPAPKPQATPSPQAKPTTPAPQQTQASPAPQAKPQVSNLTRQGKERTPAQMAAAKRIASGKTIADVKAANTQSMRDRARARNAAFKAKRAGNTTPAPTQEKQAAPAPQAKQAETTSTQAKPTANTVTKSAPAGTPVRKVTSSTTQSGNTTSTQTNVKSGVTGGTTKDLTSSAGSLQKNKEKAKQIANTANKNAAMTGSGGTTTVGKIDDF